jgi:hypothetical protein
MFNKPSIADYYRKVFAGIERQILGEKDESIIGTNIDELAEYYYSNNCLSPIEFDTERQEQMEHRKELRIVKAQERERGYQSMGDTKIEYESIIVTIPIIPNKNLEKIWELQTSTFDWEGEPNTNLGTDIVLFSIDIKGYGFNYNNDDEIASRIRREKEKIQVWINRRNDDIRNENKKLESSIKPLIEERKRKLTEDIQRINSLSQKINIPLKMKENEAVKRIQLDKSPLVKRVKPVATLPEEYVLDRDKVLDIISIIDNQGRQFEKTPKTYECFQEEGFRDVILVALNPIFEGRATGETFSGKGKTDIYLNIDKGNILICECKIWSGRELYNVTINQIRGYVTWRNNFGIIITFAKLKNFSKILEEIEDIVTKHPSYAKEFRKVSETHFSSYHVLEQDSFKNIEIHHLFYNLYSS